MNRFSTYSRSALCLMVLLPGAFLAGCGGGSGGSGTSQTARGAGQFTNNQETGQSSNTQVIDQSSSILGSGVEGGTSFINIPGGPISQNPAVVNLRTAADYVILTETGITNVPTSEITGNLGVSPIAAAAITGFSLVRSSDGRYSTSSQVTGKVYAADYTPPTPANLTTNIGDMHTAYLDAAGRPVTAANTNIASGRIGGLTLGRGVYKWSTPVSILGNVYLRGTINDVWIFQVSGGVTMASATQVILTGGARAKNVFWQVAGVVAIGTTAHMQGEVMSKTAITLNTGATATGRLLAMTNVTLIKNTVVQD